MTKGSGSILSSISFRSFEVSTAINDMIDLCPNLWCNNSTAIFLYVVFSLTCHFLFLPNMHVASVHYVEESKLFFSYLQIKTFKTLCEINKYITNSLT